VNSFTTINIQEVEKHGHVPRADSTRKRPDFNLPNQRHLHPKGRGKRDRSLYWPTSVSRQQRQDGHFWGYERLVLVALRLRRNRAVAPEEHAPDFHNE
jgi:hypothetical protein